MKWRSFAMVIWCALSLRLVTGCAKTPTLPEDVAIGNRAQLVIAGATLSGVKDLAMDSARARGWTIIKSQADILILQRSLAPSSASAQALGSIPSTAPPVIEVTSALVEHSDGVTVALGATLITRTPGETSPKRADYTDNFRGALTQSLESLRTNWMTSRRRVGDAIPTQPADSQPPRAGTSRTDPITPASGQTTDGPAAKRAMTGDTKTLTQSSRTGVWAYYAEQYARLRGCDLTDAGAQLIESRADGEIHKVFCIGSESYLLNCQGGVCRGLR